MSTLRAVSFTACFGIVAAFSFPHKTAACGGIKRSTADNREPLRHDISALFLLPADESDTVRTCVPMPPSPSPIVDLVTVFLIRPICCTWYPGSWADSGHLAEDCCRLWSYAWRGQIGGASREPKDAEAPRERVEADFVAGEMRRKRSPIGPVLFADLHGLRRSAGAARR